MNRPRQFQVTVGEVAAIQRDGTLHTDLDIAEWMERSHPHGEYHSAADAFAVKTPTVELPAGTAFTCAVAEAPTKPPLCSEWCDAVPPADLHHLTSGVRLCTDCLLEYQLLLEAPELAAELDRKPAPRSTPQEARP